MTPGPRPRDRRAQYIPAPQGRLHPLRPKRVTVIGGGIAGLAAATILAEHGVKVTADRGRGPPRRACGRMAGR